MSTRKYNKIFAKRGHGVLSYVLVSYTQHGDILTEHKYKILGKVYITALLPITYLVFILTFGKEDSSSILEYWLKLVQGKSFSKDLTKKGGKGYNTLSNFIDTGVLGYV